MAANNVAEIILRVTTEGQDNAQALAVQLTQLDQATNKVMTTTLAAATAQKSFNTEMGKTPPQQGPVSLRKFRSPIRNWKERCRTGAICKSRSMVSPRTHSATSPPRPRRR